jgi:hypothetical protein
MTCIQVARENKKQKKTITEINKKGVVDYALSTKDKKKQLLAP